VVIKTEDWHEGINPLANYITIQHEDGNRSHYAHIKKGGALVRVGDSIKQGQAVALSGMVGQTLFPHVHFYISNAEGFSIPISFQEVPGGVPFAGHFYVSANGE
jgi:murein DD-endopeptidase MepM/ murein hydrolase activator NlpD